LDLISLILLFLKLTNIRAFRVITLVSISKRIDFKNKEKTLKTNEKMTPRIETIGEKKLIGKKLSMSYADYRIGELWRSFMPRRKEIMNQLSNDLISLVIYQPNHFEDFKPTNAFDRWATVEVADYINVPDEMETFILTSGQYAVFHYIGLSNDIAGLYRNIFDIWLPNSEYDLDDRPHFEILGDKYKNNDPLSEEEIWIPIKLRGA